MRPEPAAPIAITMGDPCGVGPEIVAKSFRDRSVAARAIVIGDAGLMTRMAARFAPALAVRAIDDVREAGSGVLGRRAPDFIPVLSPITIPADLPVGRVDPAAGRAAYRYVELGIELALSGRVSALVTAPISKEAMRAAGILYAGHTEILADKSGTPDCAMMLANEELRVLLVTIHIPLANVLAAITEETELRAIRLAHRACLALGLAAPRVAVAGLNPHAGESGLFGREDQERIAPAIARARHEGIDVSGPWPGDTVFMRARNGEFDIVVAQYHDQGLIPVKYLGIENGVNVTVGLPFIRTSVDHGTAFDIAGKGLADHRSMISAIRYAEKLAEAAHAPGRPSS
jgi:4-hydroxythreonine-4-phosphate dehydrogenase